MHSTLIRFIASSFSFDSYAPLVAYARIFAKMLSKSFFADCASVLSEESSHSSFVLETSCSLFVPAASANIPGNARMFPEELMFVALTEV